MKFSMLFYCASLLDSSVVFFVSGCVHALGCPVGLKANDMAAGGWKIFCSVQGAASVDCCCFVRFVCPSLISVDVGVGGGSGRYVYQLVTEKSGWFLLPTCLGGSVLRWVVSSFGEPEFWVDLVAPALWFLDEVMVDGHLLLGCSAFLRYVDDFDILLLEAIKNYVSSSVRGTASSCWKLSSPVTRTTGVFLQGLSCIFSIFQGCLCKNVNFENHM